MIQLSKLNHKIIFIFAALFMLMLPFFNCGMPIDSGVHHINSIEDSYSLPEGVTTGNDCQDIMLKTYLKKNGYYHTIRSLDCRGCHHSDQNIAPKFASVDPLESWAAFYQKEISEGNKVSANMTGTHKLTPPESRASNSELVSALRLDMNDSVAEYKNCIKADLPVETPYASPEVALAAVYQPATLTSADLVTSSVSGTSTGLTSDTSSYNVHKYQRLVYDTTTRRNKVITINKYIDKVITFDLSAGAYTDTTNKQRIPIIITFTVRPTVSYTAVKQIVAGANYTVDYARTITPEIRVFDMTVKLKNQLADTKKSILIEKLMFSFNKKSIEGATIYSILSENICTTTATPAMKSVSPQLMVFPIATDLTQGKLTLNLQNVAVIVKNSMPCISVGDVADPLPATITYRELSDPSSSNGVFARYCFECHKAGGAGSFDITTYASAKAKATQILSRMNNAADPMPRSGRLSDRNRALVDLWIQKNTPQ